MAKLCLCNYSQNDCDVWDHDINTEDCIHLLPLDYIKRGTYLMFGTTTCQKRHCLLKVYYSPQHLFLLYLIDLRVGLLKFNYQMKIFINLQVVSG